MKAAEAASAGADHVINYREEDVAKAPKSIAPDGVDLVIEVDLSGNANNYPRILKEHSRVVVYGMNAPKPRFRPYA